MSLARQLASHEPSIIKDTLFSLLNETTTSDVLKLDDEFNHTHDKHAFLADFEATKTAPPKRDPVLLERWTHYRWIRLELTYLINQKATLNRITDVKSDIEKLNPSEDKTVPAMLDSVDRAIQEDALNGVPITKSIDILRQMSLQIIGTEHPTDPLSQEARDLLLNLGQAIDETKPDATDITKLFRRLQTTDAIPPSKRSVEEEVNRNINITLDKLYDNVPHLVKAILSAYKKYYGPETYAQYEDEILSAMEGNQSAPSLLRDGAWPGYDADGNSNVTAATMKNAIRLQRIQAAEKHIATLEATVIETAKNIERDLRMKISQLNLTLFKFINKEPEEVRLCIFQFQNEASQFLIDRKFLKLVSHYEDLRIYLQLLTLDQKTIDELAYIPLTQLSLAKQLVNLTRLSGMCTHERRQKGEGEQSPKTEAYQEQGALQTLKKIFSKYKDDIRENSDAIHIGDIPASLFVTQHFHELLNTHHDLLMNFPELYRQMRYFGVQLHCFGMTYGVGHVRQDSSVFFNVWNAILSDLNIDSLNGRTYLALNEDERLSLHKQLQDGSPESKKILETIFHKYKHSKYILEAKYKHSAFDCVRSELARVELALKHDDMFDNIIISNCETAANILEVKSLLAIFPKRPGQQPLRVVPLLEKREDLERYERILTDNTEEAMFGFSDTQRVSGEAALITIQKTKEAYINLAKKQGETPKIYHGPGGDPNRGGLKRRDQKATLQGNARSNVLNTAKSTHWFRENQFYHTHELLSDPSKTMELTPLPAHLQEPLTAFTKEGTRFYEHLHDAKSGLGKLTGLMLGQGAQWMVTILNSSSRATQRGATDNTGDRTASVQTDGIRPDTFIHLDKQRAITATQAKEMLRDNLDFVGTGHGLRFIGQQNVERLYDTSETFRDVVEKSLLGEATRDLSFLAHTLFADHPELAPKDTNQITEWANECRETYPERLKTMNIEAMSKDPAKRTELLTMLSRLFAYLKEESQLNREFLFKLNRSIHCEHPSRDTLTKPTDLLFHAPAWQAQTVDLVNEVEPLSYLFARQSHFVARGGNLDEIYPGLNNQSIANSLLSGVGRLIGNIGSAITAFRQMQPGLTENIHHDYRPNLRPGVMRVEMERGKYAAGFFKQTRKEVAPLIEQAFRRKATK